ncbi:MAG: hypothetical protein J4451_02500 [DPANN group archaeon]|nr:hypothetical protein [DPANN group archaeon]
MNKRGIIEDMVAFLVAFVILSVIFLVLLIAITIPFFGQQAELSLVFDEDTGSKVCQQNLLSYLKATDSSGREFAKQIIFADKDASLRENLVIETEKFFENYKRGIELRNRWFIQSSKNNVNFFTAGELVTYEPKDSCSQYIPGLAGEKILVTLGVEY